MKKVPNSILCGALVILATIILYCTVLGNIFAQIICFVTLMGVVVAEATVTAMAYFSRGVPGKVGATVITAVMVPIAVLLSVVYITNFPDGYLSYLGYYCVTLAMIVVIDIVLWTSAAKRKAEKDGLQNAKTNIIELRKLVKCVLLKPEAEALKKELDAIEEKLHFTNDAVVTASDSVIRQMLIDLDNNIGKEGFDAAAHIKAISNEIDRRTIFARSTV